MDLAQDPELPPTARAAQASQALDKVDDVFNNWCDRWMTDEQLMQAVCEGDRSAYQELVKRHLKSVSHYCYRLLGNVRDTEDIAQEAFLKLWLNAGKWDSDRAKLGTWLHRIAHNLCIDHLRKQSRVQLSDAPEQALYDEQSNTRPEAFANHEAHEEGYDALEEGRKQRLLRKALDELPEGQRTALLLCHYQNFSNKEAAAIMNLSVKALESSIVRARRTLKLTVQRLSRETEHKVEQVSRED